MPIGLGSTGTGSVPDTIYYDGNAYHSFEVPGNTGNLAKPGYQWLGWAWEASATHPNCIGGEQIGWYSFNSIWEQFLEEGVTLYAVWKVAHTCTMSYNGNGNTSGAAPTDGNSPYQSGSMVTVLGQGTLTKTNNTFLGWAADSNACCAQYTQGSTFIINENVVLYAVWGPPCTVTYDGNGNSAGSVPVDSSSPYQHGSTVTVLGNINGLWLTGFNFAGWSTDPLDIWPTIAPGETFTITENTTLYAIWLYGGPPVGNLYSVNYNGNGHTSGYPPTDWTYPAGATVTVLGKNTLEKTGKTFLGWATTSNAITPNRMPGSTFGMPPNSITLYAVWGSGGGGGGSTIVVPYNGRYVGNGSKQSTVSYTGASTIMQIATNLPNNTDSSAAIENLIIDGLNLSNNATGILLENVCGCLIRNVTIMNCEVGIRVKLTGDNDSFSRDNRFEHIRMINVKTGILFEGTSSAKDFSYTTIDDVGISLAGNSSDAGIKVGTNSTNANLYSAFIKANIWLNGSNGAGLIVNDQLKGSLVNLAVMESAQYNSGKCIILNSGANISVNQSFLLTVLGVANNITNNGGTYSGIKIVP
jgi:uncharacterized repeat protein (TIGR02543 family)